ncbi:hypothetical protein ABIB10_005914 [Bradyrhizobium sp. RT3b]
MSCTNCEGDAPPGVLQERLDIFGDGARDSTSCGTLAFWCAGHSQNHRCITPVYRGAVHLAEKRLLLSDRIELIRQSCEALISLCFSAQRSAVVWHSCGAPATRELSYLSRGRHLESTLKRLEPSQVLPSRSVRRGMYSLGGRPPDVRFTSNIARRAHGLQAADGPQTEVAAGRGLINDLAEKGSGYSPMETFRCSIYPDLNRKLSNRLASDGDRSDRTLPTLSTVPRRAS